MRCRVCSGEVRPFMDFGRLPLGNAFLRPGDFASERKYRLQLAFCPDCLMVQQTHPPPRRALMGDYANYSYVPFGDTLDRHYGSLAQALSSDLGLTKESFVLDIGSNNGLLLGKVKGLTNCRVLGVEPAIKISEMARQRGVPTVTGFFTPDAARQIRRAQGLADVIIMTQVLQHMPDLKRLMRTVVESLSDDGVLVVEGRYFTDTMKKRSYDTVYHEMLWFFTLQSLRKLFEASGLAVIHVEKNDIYGGSLRVYAKKGRARGDRSVERTLGEEATYGVRRFGSYLRFAQDVFRLREELRRVVKARAAQGSVVGYGAPSTSATLLNFCGIGAEIAYIVDDSRLKQGLYTPGTHIRIADSAAMYSHPPDYLLLLAWRLEEEILGKVKDLRGMGMKVIVPFPRVRMI